MRIEKLIIFINRRQFPIMKPALVGYKGIEWTRQKKNFHHTRE